MTTYADITDEVAMMLAFDQWWDSDEAFNVRHDDEKTQARAAFMAAYRLGYQAGYAQGEDAGICADPEI